MPNTEKIAYAGVDHFPSGSDAVETVCWESCDTYRHFKNSVFTLHQCFASAIVEPVRHINKQLAGIPLSLQMFPPRRTARFSIILEWNMKTGKPSSPESA
jgi:hypothetical protein